MISNGDAMCDPTRRHVGWADLDGETLVWAEDGCLHRAPVLATEIGEACVLFDFNGMKFERRIAPY